MNGCSYHACVAPVFYQMLQRSIEEQLSLAYLLDWQVTGRWRFRLLLGGRGDGGAGGAGFK